MTIDHTAFRTYDVRGKVGASVTPELALELGRSLGSHIKSIECQSHPRVAVGRDNRASSEELKNALVAGLSRVGCDVVDVGLSTSPLLYFTVASQELAGGVNVTGSHNPIDENGFKLVGKGARPIAAEELQQLLQLIVSKEFSTGDGHVSSLNVVESYFDRLMRHSRITKPIRVVIDCGNGVTGLFAPTLLRQVGCEVHELYCTLDSTFPNHLPDPQMPENVAELQRRVLDAEADLGLAFDGDGDRLGIVDNAGERYEADYALMLLARDLLNRHPNSRVLVDVKMSQVVIDDIRAHTGEPVMSQTGHSLIKLRMRNEHIPLGGESSGHLYFGDHYYIDDALLAACKLLTFVSGLQASVSDLFSRIEKWHSTPEIRVSCADDVKYVVVAGVARILRQKYLSDETDGIRVTFPDGWALVRASNTGPNLTLRFEARTAESLESIKDEILALVRNQMAHAARDAQ